MRLRWPSLWPIYEGVFPVVLARPLLLLVMDRLKITRRLRQRDLVCASYSHLRDFFRNKLAFQSSILSPAIPYGRRSCGDTLVFAYGTHFYGGFRTAIEQAASILQAAMKIFTCGSPSSRPSASISWSEFVAAGCVRYPGADLRCVEPGRLPFANQSFERWL